VKALWRPASQREKRAIPWARRKVRAKGREGGFRGKRARKSKGWRPEPAGERGSTYYQAHDCPTMQPREAKKKGVLKKRQNKKDQKNRATPHVSMEERPLSQRPSPLILEALLIWKRRGKKKRRRPGRQEGNLGTCGVHDGKN